MGVIQSIDGGIFLEGDAHESEWKSFLLGGSRFPEGWYTFPSRMYTHVTASGTKQRTSGDEKKKC